MMTERANYQLKTLAKLVWNLMSKNSHDRGLRSLWVRAPLPSLGLDWARGLGDPKREATPHTWTGRYKKQSDAQATDTFKNESWEKLRGTHVNALVRGVQQQMAFKSAY